MSNMSHMISIRYIKMIPLSYLRPQQPPWDTQEVLAH
jgi:hypothetical protein